MKIASYKTPKKRQAGLPIEASNCSSIPVVLLVDVVLVHVHGRLIDNLRHAELTLPNICRKTEIQRSVCKLHLRLNKLVVRCGRDDRHCLDPLLMELMELILFVWCRPHVKNRCPARLRCHRPKCCRVDQLTEIILANDIVALKLKLTLIDAAVIIGLVDSIDKDQGIGAFSEEQLRCKSGIHLLHLLVEVAVLHLPFLASLLVRLNMRIDGCTLVDLACAVPGKR